MNLVPDFQGGLTVLNLGTSPATAQKLDGVTGQSYPAYTYSSAGEFPNPPLV